MADGFIKVMRETGEQLITSDPNAYLILSLCTFRAAWKDNPVTGLKIGQAMMGFTDFPYMSRDKYRGACKRILDTGLATMQTTNKGTVVSLNQLGFAAFGDTRTPIKNPIKPPSNPPETPTNKEVRSKNKEKNIPPPLADVVSYFESKGKTVAMANNFFDYYESNGWKVGKNLMKKWHNAASGWMARQRDEVQNQGGNFLKKSNQELLRLCTERGIRTHGLLREEIIAKLGVPA